MSANEAIIQVTTPETPKERRAREKLERKVQKQADLDAKMARYAQLRANVRRRRTGYVLFIILALVVFVATVVDIVYNKSQAKWYLLSAYVVLLILGILMLISRRRQLEDINQIKAIERTWLECDNCSAVFQFGSESFDRRRRVGFTCPVCGDESALPVAGMEPVERPLPPGRLEESNYLCGNCKEDIVVGVYGGVPRAVTFRACPNCGVTGQVTPNPMPA